MDCEDDEQMDHGSPTGGSCAYINYIEVTCPYSHSLNLLYEH